MYAIVEIAGHQYKVEKDQQVFVNRLDAEEGKKVKFDRVLLVDNGKDVQVGAPAVSGAEVTAQVERHLKGDKVLVFKKKRRKGYQKLNGFRASLTEVKITAIKASGAKKAAPKAAAADKPAAEKKAAAKKPAAKKPAAKKPAAKKPAAKKPAAKKPAAKKPAAKKTAAKKTDKTEK
jgi:large subunit ribosomal protein L21